jgi:hypothetical protein
MLDGKSKLMAAITRYLRFESLDNVKLKYKKLLQANCLTVNPGTLHFNIADIGWGSLT